MVAYYLVQVHPRLFQVMSTPLILSRGNTGEQVFPIISQMKSLDKNSSHELEVGIFNVSTQNVLYDTISQRKILV